MQGIGVNGFGRIGKLVIRRAMEDVGNTILPIRAINSSYSAETIAYMLKYDSTHGSYLREITTDGSDILVDGIRIKTSNEREPSRIPWTEMGVHTVIEATGQFNHREGASLHLSSGAMKVIITAPGKDMDGTIVMGVNDHLYQEDQHHILSSASCTTNCVAPVLDMIHRSFGIEDGWVTSIHAVTNDQRHLDTPHQDLRRARSCMQSIIPTTTGIGKALQEVLPHLSDHIHGLSVRVPVTDVSIADMTLRLRRSTSIEEVLEVMTSKLAKERHIDVSTAPLVSVDFIGNSHSAIIDKQSMICSGSNLKLLAWYDNEWGYACRVVDLARKINRKTRIGVSSLC